MSFDRQAAERSLVQIVDLLGGDRVVGMGFRVGEAIATSCRCLPRPRGEVALPDPDAPAVLVLVRARRPGSARAAAAVVTFAEPCSGLALLQATSISGLTVPDELSPVLSAETLIAELRPAVLDLAPPDDGAVFVCTDERAWVEGRARSDTVEITDGAGHLGSATLGAPVFGEEGHVIGMIVDVHEAGHVARMALLSEQLPGWALRAAEARGQGVGAGVSAA